MCAGGKMGLAAATAKVDQKLKALDAFKDWSNYLLVTTVAALGWTTAKDAAHFSATWIQVATILLFALSVVFAILTLALIPHISENLEEGPRSIYETSWDGWLRGKYQLMDFCFVQHLLFLLGIIVYAAGTSFATDNPAKVCCASFGTISQVKQSIWAMAFCILSVVSYLGSMLLFVWMPRRKASTQRPNVTDPPGFGE
jgi:cytochrome bd-type quinol oxidase subunit 2